MFLWIVKQVIISLIIIILVHYLYIFFKTNLTVPKIKDLVHRPEQKYAEIYKSPNPAPKHENKTNMKLELKNYLKNLKNDSKPILAANTLNNVSNF